MVSTTPAKAEKKTLPKRFYAAANLQQIAGGFAITLDDKIIKTPQRKNLYCAPQQLAQQIVAEWAAQVDVIDTDTMPLTRLLNIALDRVEGDRVALLEEMNRYVETDLLFYRASQPENALIVDTAAAELIALQQEYFTPILVWGKQTYGATFNITEGIMPIVQPAESLAAIAAVYAEANSHELAALAMMVPILGSALLALAVWKGQLGVEEALIAARLDETVQAKHWGEDPETVAAWQTKCRDVRACAFFLTCSTLN